MLCCPKWINFNFWKKQAQIMAELLHFDQWMFIILLHSIIQIIPTVIHALITVDRIAVQSHFTFTFNEKTDISEIKYENLKFNF